MRMLDLATALILTVGSTGVRAATIYDSGPPDGRAAFGTGGGPANQAADDFTLLSQTTISGGTFTGLIAGPGASTASIQSITLAFFRVYPADSSSSPSGQVPTRAGSPADTPFATFQSGLSEFSFASSTLAPTFTVTNSIQSGGIHPAPNNRTGGNGLLSGTEIALSFAFTTPVTLDAGQYFFAPVVQLSGQPGVSFAWLSAAGPSAPGSEVWVRDSGLSPDWLRAGTDIVGNVRYNAAFSLLSAPASDVPEPASWAMMIVGLGTAGAMMRRTRRVRINIG